MDSVLIIGSGPSAAGAAIALTRDTRLRVAVIDIGGTLETELDQRRIRLAETDESRWDPADLAAVARHAEATGRGTLPQKLAFGSDFPFRDLGQLDGIRPVGAANDKVVSSAYGGFSNVWGAQLMPFSRATLDRWPIPLASMEPHYRVALAEMTLAGEEDDLAEQFPLLVNARPLPDLAARSKLVLARYERHRARVRSHGITVGRARLAFRADECTSCGLCMTGCPHGLVYSSSHTFDRLRAQGRIDYRPGVMALRIEETDGKPSVLVRDMASGTTERMGADRIFVGCGGLGTTRLVLGSLGRFGRPISMQESVQFVVPTISARAVADPRGERSFTLNQFNLLFDPVGNGEDLCQVHFYDYNPAMLNSIPGILRRRAADPLLGRLLSRIGVGLGYLPGWASPLLSITATNPGSSDRLADLRVDREEHDLRPPALRRLLAAMVRVAPDLDLWPVVPMVSLSGAAKGYHFGSSFPHTAERSETTSDRLGRIGPWDRVHLIDASVFPTVPATTFTLTIQANAHRIATEVLETAQ